MHLRIEESPASWIVKLFGEVGESVMNTFHQKSFSENDVVKSYREKTVLKTLQLEFRIIVFRR